MFVFVREAAGGGGCRGSFVELLSVVLVQLGYSTASEVNRFYDATSRHNPQK